MAGITVVTEEGDAAVAPLEPHHITRLRIGAVCEDRDHFPSLEPGGGEPHTIELVVDGEEPADLRGAGAKRIRGLMQFDVVGQQRPQAVPVPLVEQRDIARYPSARLPRVWKRRGSHVDLPKTPATPPQLVLRPTDRHLKPIRHPSHPP